jgi:hypothetical protein
VQHDTILVLSSRRQAARPRLDEADQAQSGTQSGFTQSQSGRNRGAQSGTLLIIQQCPVSPVIGAVVEAEAPLLIFAGLGNVSIQPRFCGTVLSWDETLIDLWEQTMVTSSCWAMGLSVTYLALVLLPPLSAQEPKLRTTLKISTGSGTALAFSSNNKLMVTGGTDGVVRVWDVKTSKEKAVCKGHKGQVYSVAFCPVGKLFASASEDETIKLWNSDTGKETRTFHHMVSAYSVAFSPDGKIIETSRSTRPEFSPCTD